MRFLPKDNLDETDISLWDELDDSIESQGDSTSIVISSEAVNFIAKTGKQSFSESVSRSRPTSLSVSKTTHLLRDKDTRSDL